VSRNRSRTEFLKYLFGGWLLIGLLLGVRETRRFPQLSTFFPAPDAFRDQPLLWKTLLVVIASGVLALGITLWLRFGRGDWDEIVDGKPAPPGHSDFVRGAIGIVVGAAAIVLGLFSMNPVPLVAGVAIAAFGAWRCLSHDREIEQYEERLASWNATRKPKDAGISEDAPP
jgi:hypothetical protein